VGRDRRNLLLRGDSAAVTAASRTPRTIGRHCAAEGEASPANPFLRPAVVRGWIHIAVGVLLVLFGMGTVVYWVVITIF
jgi:hypothetical protein